MITIPLRRICASFVNIAVAVSSVMLGVSCNRTDPIDRTQTRTSASVEPGGATEERSGPIDWTQTRTVWVSEVLESPLETINGDELASIAFKAALVVPQNSWSDAERKAKLDEASDNKIPVKIKCWLWYDFVIPAGNDSGSMVELFSARIYAEPESAEQIGNTGKRKSFAYSKKKEDSRNRELYFYKVELEGQISYRHLTANESRLKSVGTVTGRVTRNGRPIEGVIVGVRGADEIQGVKTDAKGQFTLRKVPPGYNAPRWKTTEAGRWTWYAAGGPGGFLEPGGSLDIGDLDLEKPALRLEF